MGITNQIENMTCDGKPIQEEKPGVWNVPRDCKKIQWQVSLIKSGAELASAQQSIKSADFMLFSEASSLARVKNSTLPEFLKISVPHLKSTFPALDSSNEISLPKVHAAPLFVI
jgi:hypothetical protein